MKKTMMKINSINKIKIIKTIIIFSYLACWLSISTNFEDLKLIFETNNFNIFNLINFLRHLSVYIFFFISLTMLISYFQFEKEKLKINFIYILIFFYFLFQITGLILTDNNLENISFIISAITIIFTILLINIFFTFNEKKIFIYLFLSILFIVFSIKFIPDFINFLNGNYTMYGSFDPNSKYFVNKVEPRSSGLSRSLLIIFIFLEVLILNSKKKSNLFELTKILIISIIFLFQSRLIIFLLILYLITTFIINGDFKIKYFFSFIFKYIIIPTSFFLLLTNNYAIQKNKMSTELNNDNSTNNIIENTKKNLRPIDSFSSGRIDDWKNIIKKYDLKIIYGYGAQGDRYLINQSASNGVIYALTSSGIAGLILFLSFSLISLKLSLRNLKKNIFIKSTYLYCSNFVILIILLRSIFESGYAVFGIDYIIFMTCLSITKTK